MRYGRANRHRYACISNRNARVSRGEHASIFTSPFPMLLAKDSFFQDIEGKTKISFPISFFYKMPLRSRALYLTGLPIKLTRECNYKIK